MTNSPKVAKKGPYKISVEEGKLYAWCTCGHSEKQPFCDGAHREHAPEYKSLKWVADETKEVYFCGCKQVKDSPFCDGSHNKL